MKKIVALVLSLVMVLGLATVAFAAADSYDLYQADADMKANLKTGVADIADITVDAVAAKTNKDGSGSVAYMNLGDGTYYAVKTSAPTVSSYAVCEKGKTAVLYYVDILDGASEATFAYEKVVTAVKAADVTGMACGQYGVNATTIEAGDVFFAVDGVLYKAVEPGTENYKLGDKVVGAEEVADVIDHVFTVAANKYDETLKAVVPTVARCTNPFCGVESKAIYLVGKAPAESTVYDLDNTGYVVALGAAATTPAEGDKVESAETFDAGIAMYVGMSVMAAAGSAVVLKKKD